IGGSRVMPCNWSPRPFRDSQIPAAIALLQVIIDVVLNLGQAVRRRDFIRLVGSAAASWPFAAGAQQSSVPMIGMLDNRPPEVMTARLRAFRLGLKETGYVEGENVAIEYRFAP